MQPASPDARWPQLLSLAVHELRTPMTVVSGYIRMLLKERAGPLSEQQRRLLEEAEKSCGRLSALIAEMSDLSNLESGTVPFNRSTVNLRTIVGEAIAGLSPLADRDVHVELQPSDARVDIQGDATRLRTAVSSLLLGLRRGLVASDRLMLRLSTADIAGVPSVVLAIGGHEEIDAIEAADPSTLTPFDEWRGGSGLSLANARRVIGQHSGQVLSPPGETKAGAVVIVPKVSTSSL